MKFSKGSKHSQETKDKIRLSHVGRKLSVDWKKNISNSRMGKKHSAVTKKKISEGNRGKIVSLETREKMSKVMRGKNHPNWKGGKTLLRKKLYFSPEYKLWRKSVFERDNYTCIWCGIGGSQTGGTLNADHIKPWAYFPELRFAIDNGRTLCVPCHKMTDTYGRLADKYKKPCLQ